MRKLFILPIILATFLCCGDSFSAPRGRATPTAKTGSAPAANGARAAKMSAPVAKTGSVPAANGARAAKMSAPVATGSKITSTTQQNSNKGIGARAAAKQKVIQTGTKIETATTNTVVSQDCQNAFFGCMDSFCMIENTTGGRCRCSDRNKELNNVLAQIEELDAQSYAMATVGVEQLEMGDAADDVMAKADAAAKKALAGLKTGSDAAGASSNGGGSNSSKVRKLDLSAWNSASFDDEEDEVFSSVEIVDDSLTSKEGDALNSAAASLCASQITQECKASASMLKLMYTQKIKSDCSAYENSLKQQKSASTQKLQTAKQALRDSALEKYRNDNKMDLGQCTIAFKQCMQTTGGCGTDWKGCVGITAAENAKGIKAQSTTIKGKYANIELGAASLQTLTDKKPLCESVLKGCVNDSARVWETFLADIAPSIKTAELLAEEDLRTNCISDLAECFKKSCGEQFDPATNEKSYDMCLTDPKMVVGACKVKLEPCLQAYGTTMENRQQNILWKGILARLKVMQVDSCTKEIRTRLTAEETCGEDYGYCIGLSVNEIMDLVPAESLLACQGEGFDTTKVKENLQAFAQSIALNIENAELEICQKAVDTAMSTYCGGEQACPKAKVSSSMFNDLLSIKICKEGEDTCSQDAYSFDKDDIIQGRVYPRLVGRVDFNNLSVVEDFANAGEQKNADGTVTNIDAFSKASGAVSKVENGYSDANLDGVVRGLNSAYTTTLSTIKNDRKVRICMDGRDFEKYGAQTTSKKENRSELFKTLLDGSKSIIATSVLNAAETAYSKEVTTKMDGADWKNAKTAIDDRLSALIGANARIQNLINETDCKSRNSEPDFGTGCASAGRHSTTSGTFPAYDSTTGICTVTYKRFDCQKMVAGCCWKWPDSGSGGVVTATNKIPMKIYTREDAVAGNDPSHNAEADEY